MPKVKLSNRKTFDVKPNESLLSSARSQGLLLEHSCRTGRCGVCKAIVLQGETRAIQSEDALSDSEINQGCILTCCRTAVTDVTLDIEDLGRFGDITIKTLPCRIDSLRFLTGDVVEIILRVPPNSKFNYIPGQYIDIIGAAGIRRSYSIANAIREDEKLELHIRKVSCGVMSEYWFSRASINDLLRLEGPLGTFSLRETEAKNLIFIATGTGIAPIKAIIEEMNSRIDNFSDKNVYLYWGGRTLDDIYIENFNSKLNFLFVPVLSRPSQGWQGKVGYVQDCIMEDKIDLTNSVVYACGSETMIQCAKELLTDNGLNPKLFYSDAFVSSN